MKLIIFFLFLMSCSKFYGKDNLNRNYNFSDDLTFDEFKIILDKYAAEQPYPKIDE